MNPAFGQPTFGQSTFGQPQFGSSANNAFAPGGKANTSSGASPFGAPNFGSNSNTQQTSAFGQPVFGSNSGSSTSAAFGNSAGSPFSQLSNQLLKTHLSLHHLGRQEQLLHHLDKQEQLLSPFGQTGTTTSPFGQTGKIENADTATSNDKTGVSKSAKPNTPTTGDAKPSVFGQAKSTESKPPAAVQPASSDAKPSIFGQANTTETKPSLFGQNSGDKSSETNTINDSVLPKLPTNTDSLVSLDKKLTLSPKKTVTRGLTGASPTKPKSSESAIISKIEKPEEPEKPQLTEKFLETLKTLSIRGDSIKSTGSKPSSNESIVKKDFKPINLDVSRGSFANTSVDESVKRVLNERKDKGLLHHDIDLFLFDQSGKKVMSKYYLHANGNAAYVNANHEILLVKKNKTQKMNYKNKLKVEDFENWEISYNGEDLLLCYYQKNNQSNIHIIDTKINEVTTLKTKFNKGIKKLTWHPLAKTSVLVFMTNENLLYQLNVWTGQLLHISKRILGFYDQEGKNSLRNVFDSLESDNEFELSNITSFELSDDGWKLYLVDSVEDNIYIICPFVPLSNRMVTTRVILSEIFEDIDWMTDVYSLEEKVDEYIFKDVQEFAEFDDWVSNGFNEDGHEIVSREVPEDWYLNMGVQGPITFSHFPERLYEHSLIDVKCISNTHDVLRQMLVLLYSNGETAVVFNTYDSVIFRNNWKTLVLNLHDLHKFVFIDCKTNNNITKFLPSNIDEGCLALTKNNEVVFLNYLDVFCRCESVIFHDAERTIYNKPSDNSPLLKLKRDYGEIFLFNNKDVIYYDEQRQKLHRVLYPSFMNVQGREFSSETSEYDDLIVLLRDCLMQEKGDDESNYPQSSTSTSCVNVYFDLLEKFEEEINNLKSINSLSTQPLLNFLEDAPESLLSSMQEFGNPISKALSLSYSLQAWMRTCLHEFKLTLDDNLQKRLIDTKEISDIIDSITKIRSRYETQLDDWGKRLTRLQSIKKKVVETEKLALESENIDTTVLENYKAAVDSKTIQTQKIMEQIKDVKKDIEFLSMKLSKDDCKNPKKNDEGIITEIGDVQKVDNNKRGKELLFSLGP
ncbi:uncharacterized protein HGUI_03537 [Hanseniaspora guilliermondii]|uniref:Uncharacterized protein n=1 Tax=Hanseniaspora guilliermondii TaxID=56406 RepID=A0A1L0B479_9ASCO|nr:uncharacterized protein HGUI_03537 [Hanseniaspora guilliermondii]